MRCSPLVCSLTWPKQCRLLRHAVASARGRLPVYAGGSGNCLTEKQERYAEVAALGADAVVCVPPFYFRNTREPSPELLEPARRLIEEEGITATGSVAGW